jgi:hypothetical protein
LHSWNKRPPAKDIFSVRYFYDFCRSSYWNVTFEEESFNINIPGNKEVNDYMTTAKCMILLPTSKWTTHPDNEKMKSSGEGSSKML